MTKSTKEETHPKDPGQRYSNKSLHTEANDSNREMVPPSTYSDNKAQMTQKNKTTKKTISYIN